MEADTLERLEIDRMINAEMLSLNPTYHAYIEKELAEKVGAAIMMRIGLSGGEYIVSSSVKEAQIEPWNSVNVKATANIKRLVRCKDCKYWHREIHDGIEYFNFSSCDLNHHGDGNNFYCADAERKES